MLASAANVFCVAQSAIIGVSGLWLEAQTKNSEQIDEREYQKERERDEKSEKRARGTGKHSTRGWTGWKKTEQDINNERKEREGHTHTHKIRIHIIYIYML